jgi:hypothetical protein
MALFRSDRLGLDGLQAEVAADELACKPGCFRSDSLTSHFP